MRKWMLLLVAAVIGLQGCQRGEDSDKVRVAIDARNKEFAAAFAKGDAAAIAGMYSSSAQLFPPNAPTVSGRDGIQKLWTEFIGAGFKGFELTSTEVEALGEKAEEEGTFKVTAPDGRTEIGKYIVIWKKEDGQWKLHRDIWNADAPPPAPPAAPAPEPAAAEAPAAAEPAAPAEAPAPATP